MRRTCISCDEHGFAFVERAGDRRRAERIGRGGKRDVSLAGQQSRRRIQADPSGAGQIHLRPRMQVGEVGGGSARTVERFDVGRQLNQVARDEARGQPKVPQRLHQQPAGVAARSARETKRLVRRLHAGLEANDVRDLLGQPGVEIDEEIDRPSRTPIDRLRRTPGAGAPSALTSRNGARSFCSHGSYVNGNCSADGSRKKSNGLKTDISATRSTSTQQLTRLLGEHDARRGNCCADPAAS